MIALLIAIVGLVIIVKANIEYRGGRRDMSPEQHEEEMLDMQTW